MNVGDTCGCLMLHAHTDEPETLFLERGGCNWQTCECACHYPPLVVDKTTDTLEGHPCCTGACLTPFVNPAVEIERLQSLREAAGLRRVP